MANDTCPHCGAAAKGPEHDWDHGRGMKTDFSCGSSRVVFFARDSLSLRQSEECKDRKLAALRNQLATVTAERDELRRRIDEAPVWWFNPADQGEPIAMIWEAAGSPAIRVRLVRDDQPEEAVT